jgi:hypothetical protein
MFAIIKSSAPSDLETSDHEAACPAKFGGAIVRWHARRGPCLQATSSLSHMLRIRLADPVAR